MEENKKRILMETLIQGRNSAKMLQNLLLGEIKDEGSSSISVDDLVMELLGSFRTGLSMVNNSSDSNSFSTVSTYSNTAGNFTCFTDLPPKVYNGSRKQTPVVKKRRGCYKRRSMASRTKVSDTIEDGYAWRKYGQKSVLDSKSPRCYYRCTHKIDHGCKALKQVQKLEEDEESNMFHITYFGHHTCPTTPPKTFSHPQTIINFKDFKNHQYSSSTTFSITAQNIHFDPSFEQKNVFDDVTNSANQFAAFGSKDTFGNYDMNACHEFASFMGFDNGGSYNASNNFWDNDKMNLFEDNNDFLNDISLDDPMFSEII